jgi:hypothetical protein
MREIVGTMAFVAIVFTALPASAGLDPCDYPYCLHGKTEATWGCVNSQATCSARQRPQGHFRTVVRILDLRTYGSRAAGDPIKYGR